MKAAVDANTLASGAVAPPGGTIAAIIDAFRAGVFELIVSRFILSELARTLAKPYFTRRVSPADLLAYQRMVSTRATITALTVRVRGVATHPEDDLKLATAVAGRAEYLVTGDSQLLRLGNFRDVAILSPRAFLDLLNSEQLEGDPR